jgi:hypothetical protein
LAERADASPARPFSTLIPRRVIPVLSNVLDTVHVSVVHDVSVASIFQPRKDSE